VGRDIFSDTNRRITALTAQILDEVFVAFGSSRTGWGRRLLWPLFWLPARRFAKLIVKYDSFVGKFGINEAARLFMGEFVKSVEVCGVDSIPREGPLLIASNHPGGYDLAAIIASLPRDDIKIIISEINLVHDLPSIERHVIVRTLDPHNRMLALRALMRHLHDGGSALIFPSGRVDPDPDVFPNAHDELLNWSPSVALILRKIHQAKIQPAIVSGVLAQTALRNPIIRIPEERWRQLKLAEFLQVMGQLLFKRRFELKIRVSYGLPLTGVELGAGKKSLSIMPAVLAEVRTLLDVHMTANPNRAQVLNISPNRERP
jgi:hypothetical protein